MADEAGHKKRKRKRAGKTDAEAERKLEAFLFDDATFHENVMEAETEAEPPRKRRKADAKAIDPATVNIKVGGSLEEEEEEEILDLEAAAKPALAPAWTDADDARVEVDVTGVSRTRKLRRTEGERIITGAEYTQRLREQYRSITGAADWADVPEDALEEGGLTKRAGAIIAGERTGGPLQQGTINLSRLKDANINGRSDAVIQALQFHPSGQMLLTAGFDKTLRLFQVDGVRNTRLQSVFVPDMPIHSAEFYCDGGQVLMAGRRKFFYSYDIEAGRIEKINQIRGREEKSFEKFVASPAGDIVAFFGQDGNAVLVSQKTKQWVANLKMNGTLRCASFSGDGTRMFTAGGDGEVYEWDMRQRRCVGRYVDSGCLNAVALSVSTDAKYHAVGSESGVVNVYDSTAMAGNKNPKPLRSIQNLTTSADQVRFNHDSQLLAISSRMKKDSLKLVHVPSMTVFSNWPVSKTPLHCVHTHAFSPNSGLFAIGNDRGRVLLYKLNHYGAA